MKKPPFAPALLLAILIITLGYLLIKSGKSSSDKKEDLFSYLSGHKNQILHFAEKVGHGALADSNFYANYWLKQDRFYFTYHVGANAGDIFEVPVSVRKDFEIAATAAGIGACWNYPGDNFYKISFRGMGKIGDKRVIILVLKPNEDRFTFKDADVNTRDTTSDLEKFGVSKDIFIFNSRIWVRLI